MFLFCIHIYKIACYPHNSFDVKYSFPNLMSNDLYNFIMCCNYFHLSCIICKIFNQYCIYIHLCCFLGIGYYGLSQQISLAYLLIIELVNVQCALDGNFTLQMKRTCNTNRNYSIYNWKKITKMIWMGIIHFKWKLFSANWKIYKTR